MNVKARLRPEALLDLNFSDVVQPRGFSTRHPEARAIARLRRAMASLEGYGPDLAQSDSGNLLNGRPARRLASIATRFQSPHARASFFAQLQPLICRSTAMASVMISKYSDQMSRTGRRVKV